MRKLLFLVLIIVGCLPFLEQSVVARVSESRESAVFSAGNSQTAQWQCERAYNSDLNQPRVLRAAEAGPAVRLFQRNSPITALRPTLRCVVSCGCGTGVAKLTSTFQSSDLSVGPRAVDYYVYRLRRLII